MAGHSLRVRERLGIALGYAGFNQDRLKGIYGGDGTDRIKDPLTPDQLVSDTFSGGFWIGVTIQT